MDIELKEIVTKNDFDNDSEKDKLLSEQNSNNTSVQIVNNHQDDTNNHQDDTNNIHSIIAKLFDYTDRKKIFVFAISLIYCIVALIMYIIYGVYELSNNISSQSFNQLIMQNCSYTDTKLIEITSDNLIMSIKYIYIYTLYIILLTIIIMVLEIHKILVKGAGKICYVLKKVVIIPSIFLYIILLFYFAIASDNLTVNCNNTQYIGMNRILSFGIQGIITGIICYSPLITLIYFTIFFFVIISQMCFLNLLICFRMCINIRQIPGKIYNTLVDDGFIRGTV